MPDSKPSGSPAGDNTILLARSLSDQGEEALRHGDLASAAINLLDAVERWREVDEPVNLATALNNLGVTFARMKEPQRAASLFTEAASLLHEAGNPTGEATALNGLGAATADMGHYAEALAHLKAALPLRRQAGDAPGELITLDQLARVSALAGEKLAALNYRRETLEIVRARGDRILEADALIKLGEALSSTGYDAEAVASLEQSAGIYEQLGEQAKVGETLLKLAQAHFDSGNMAGAATVVGRALPLLRKAGAWGPQATVWENFLLAQHMHRDVPQALKEWRRGRQAGLDALSDVVQERLSTPELQQINTPDKHALTMLAKSLQQLSSMSYPQPQTQQPTPSTDELAAQDTRSTEDLITALQSPDAPQRRKAALALGVRGDLRAVEPLISACEDRSQWVRMAAVRSLGKLRDVRALDALSRRVEDRDKEVRRSAATALGSLGDQRAVDALTIVLTDNYFRAVESAQKAFRKLKSAPNPAVLVSLLTHKDITRRCIAAQRLAGMGEVTPVGPLITEAENPGQPVVVRATIFKAIAKVGDRAVGEAALRALDEAVSSSSTGQMNMGPEVTLKVSALEALATTAEPEAFGEATPRLIAFLSDSNPYIRRGAIRALAAVGDETAIPHLERIQQTDEAAVHATDRINPQRTRLRSLAAEAVASIRKRCAN